MGQMGQMGPMGPMGGPIGGIFEDPADVIGQMMGGGPMGASLFGGRPTGPIRSDGHNIQIIPDEYQKTAKSSKNQTDGDETDSQLDAQLFDELAELGTSSDEGGTTRHDELPSLLATTQLPSLLATTQSQSQIPSEVSNESSLNDDRSNNNSALSINDAVDK